VAHVKQIVITCVVAVWVVVGGGNAAAQSTAADGEKVFAAQKCAICHAVGGQGNKKGPLDNVGAKWSADEIRMWITQAPVMAAKVKAERKPAMKAFTALSKEEVDALVAYLQTLKKG
jgi:mono/diheme cytochrome c family protein